MHVSSKVVVTIQAHDGIEKLVRERQGVRLRVKGKHAILEPGLPDALPVIHGIDPDIRGPDLDIVFPRQENRAQGLAAPHVEHAHAGAEFHFPA